MIGILKKNHYGRATFLPLTTVTPKQEEAFRGELLSEEGVMGKMSAHVSRDAKYDKVVEYLLGRYLLVDTLDHAMSISKKYHYSVRMVTLDGELLNPGGSMSGGAFRNNSNLLGRKREMDSLQQQVEKEKKNLIRCARVFRTPIKKWSTVSRRRLKKANFSGNWK